MHFFENPIQWILGILLILSSVGVIAARRPIYASLSFLLTLMTLASLYLQLSAQFIGVMQVLVYAGAILVLFMYVIVLFQDAHAQISRYESKGIPLFMYTAGLALLLLLAAVESMLLDLIPIKNPLPDGFGSVESLGQLLYVDFFFPFEAVILLFLVALIGAAYIGKKVRLR